MAQLLNLPGICNGDDPQNMQATQTTPEIAKHDVNIVQLKSDVERLVHKHKSEINACLDLWFHDHDVSPQTHEVAVNFELQGIATQSTESNKHMTAIIPVQSTHVAVTSGLSLPNVATTSIAGKRSQSLGATNGKIAKPFNSITMETLGDKKDAKKSERVEADVLGQRKQRKIIRKVSDFLFQASRAEAEMQLTMLQRLTSSRYYEAFSAALILSNAIFIGWQTQYMAERATDDRSSGQAIREESPASFVILGAAFTLAFVIELALRWVAVGFLGFFQSNDVSWNIMDVTIVTLSVLDTFMEIVIDVEGSEITSRVSVLRVFRVVRVVRVAKVIRVMRFFRELRIMVFSILGSLKSLIWVVLVLGVMFYVFGITFTAAAAMDNGTNTDLQEHFGTLDKSVVSLYMAMSGGNDWGQYYFSLMVLSWPYRIIFLIFITFALFAVVNIVTGVFVDAAMQANQMDREIVVHEELESKRGYLLSMQQIFEEMDTDSTGYLTLVEFEHRLNDERVIAYFRSLKLDVSEARVLFEMLDLDHTGEVTIEEFLCGCYRLQGEARTMDMKIMQFEVSYIKEVLLDLSFTFRAFRECWHASPLYSELVD